MEPKISHIYEIVLSNNIVKQFALSFEQAQELGMIRKHSTIVEVSVASKNKSYDNNNNLFYRDAGV